MFPQTTHFMPDGTAQLEYADGTIVIRCEDKHFHRFINDKCVYYNDEHFPCDGCCTEYERV